MILIGNSRGGGQDLATHLLKPENEHIEVYDMRGFAADDLHGAFKEVHALSKATKAKKYLFSLSLNPPEGEAVTTKDFEKAIEQVEKQLNLIDQPRAIVFHEKEGRRHCHTVWSRVDVDALKVIPMDYCHNKLQDCARELYLQHGWQMPRGFIQGEPCDPKNFTLAQWQQAKRQAKDPRAIKSALQDSWAVSDDRASFAHALGENGYVLAKGDRRGFVAIDREGEVYAIAKWVGVKTRQVRDRLGKTQGLPSVEEAQIAQAKIMQVTVKQWQNELRNTVTTLKTVLKKQRNSLTIQHQQDRSDLMIRLERRQITETKVRQDRYRKGLLGLWDRLRGAHGKIAKRNERDAIRSNERDRREWDELVAYQLTERLKLKQAHKDQLKRLTKKRTSLRIETERILSKQAGRSRERDKHDWKQDHLHHPGRER